MAARPPPARPHIGLNPSSHFSYSFNEWGEDDAWDSGSDPESPPAGSTPWNRSPPTNHNRPNSQSSAPKPVPKSSLNSSTSTLAFSYTHVAAPGPSSYPSKQEHLQPSRNGWTLVEKSDKGSTGADGRGDIRELETVGDVDVEGDMIVGDLDVDLVEDSRLTKPMWNRGSVKSDARDIVDGTCIYHIILVYVPSTEYLDPLHLIRRRASKRANPSVPNRSRSHSPAPGLAPEKVMRQHSINSNRRNKFIECLSREDVDMGRFYVRIHAKVVTHKCWSATQPNCESSPGLVFQTTFVR